MSRHDYEIARYLASTGAPVDALVMAAMIRADNINASFLREAFPGLWNEMQARYHAPGGRLLSDPLKSWSVE